MSKSRPVGRSPSGSGRPSAAHAQVAVERGLIGGSAQSGVEIDHCSRCPLQKKVKLIKLQAGATQRDPNVRGCISIHIGLDNGMSGTLEPSHAVGDNVRILSTKEKCLISFRLWRGVRIDRREVELILAMDKVPNEV